MCSMPLLLHIFRQQLPFEVARFHHLRMVLSKTLPTTCRLSLHVSRLAGCAALVMDLYVQCSLAALVPLIVCASTGSRACLLLVLGHSLPMLHVVLLELRFIRHFVRRVVRSVALGMGLAVPLCCPAWLALLHRPSLSPCRFRLARVLLPLCPPCLSRRVLVGPLLVPAFAGCSLRLVPLDRAWGVGCCCLPLLCVCRP